MTCDKSIARAVRLATAMGPAAARSCSCSSSPQLARCFPSGCATVEPILSTGNSVGSLLPSIRRDHKRWLSNMATSTNSQDASVSLTKEYIRDAYKHLEETEDLDFRNQFWKKYMIQNVTWEITGNGHSLAGVRHSLAEHSDASFSKLGKKLTNPIKFVLRSIILEPDTRWASIETKGYATRTDGNPYNNDYVWLTQWNDAGKIIYVRSYHDTHLAEKALHAAAE